jgi:DNA repair protein RecO (recombination protein O)
MAVLQTKALILRHTTDREHDRLLSILTPEYGMQRLRARGTKKSVSKLAGSLEPMMEVQLAYAEGRTFGSITGSIIIDRFAALRGDVISMVMAQWLLEVTERISKPNQPESAVYELVKSALHDVPMTLALSGGKRLLLLDRWAWRLLDAEGFVPVVDRCSACGKELHGERGYDHGGFRHLEHGVVATRIDDDGIAWLQGDAAPLDSRSQFLAIHQLVEDVLLSVLDHPLKSTPVLKRLLQLERLSAPKE